MKSYVSLLAMTCSILSSSCSSSIDITEFQYLESTSAEMWVGHNRQKLEDMWSNPPKISTTGGAQTLTWTILAPIDSEEIKKNDEDILSIMRKSLSRSCFAVFTVNSENIVIEAKVRQFKGAKGCDLATIPLPDA